MTANLLVDRADIAYLGYVLDVVEPDLFAIQELGHKSADIIASRFPHHLLRPQLDSRGRGLASRLEARFGDIPLPWRAGLWATVEQGPQRWTVANVHMRNPIVFPWWRSVRIRTGQVEALFRWSEGQAEGRPIVLAGDMNASPAWPLYRRLSGRWEDLVARSALESDMAPAPTWAWRPGWPRLLRIDHVFGNGVRAVDSRVIPMHGSDHAAVVVDLVVGGAD
jgi:endonuclease/exonuclease/phosphatase family metal-dependent hydrolase